MIELEDLVEIERAMLSSLVARCPCEGDESLPLFEDLARETRGYASPLCLRSGGDHASERCQSRGLGVRDSQYGQYDLEKTATGVPLMTD